MRIILFPIAFLTANDYPGNIKYHRPWKIPEENWKYYQEWNNVIFLHWQLDYDELRKYVPEEEKSGVI